MKAKLKEIISPDVLDLENFIPKKEDNFGILLQLIVGPNDSEGEESFDVMVCTPQWLLTTYKSNDILIGRHYLIVFEYNYFSIYDKLKKIIDNTHGNDWDDIGMKISRIGKWEFEDYVEYKK